MMEDLARMREADPQEFNALPSRVRLALGHYLSAKKAAEGIGGSA